MTFLSINVARKKVTPKLLDFQSIELIPELQLMSYIYYSVQFKEKLVQAFIDLASKVNATSLMFAKKLSLQI